MLAGLVPVSAVTTPAAHAIEGFEINVASTLRAAPELYGYKIDTSDVEVDVQNIDVMNPAYRQTETLGYHKGVFRNPTDEYQSFTTAMDEVTTSSSTTVTSSHTVSVDTKTGFSYRTEAKFPGGPSVSKEFFVELSVGYAFQTQTSWTNSTTTMMRVPSQIVRVPPRSVATVVQWVDQGLYSADLGISGRIAGDVTLTRCGRSVTMPVGQLVALDRDAGRAPLFPSEITVNGDHLDLKSSARWSTNRAAHQLVDVSLTSLDGEPIVSPQPTVVPLASPAPPAPTPTSQPTSAPSAGTSQSTPVEAHTLREIIPCDQAVFGPRLTLAIPGVTHDLPALPAGVMPVQVGFSRLATKWWQWGTCVLGSDGRLYRNVTTHTVGDSGWSVAPAQKVTAMAVSSQFPGTSIYTDGRTVWDHLDAPFPALPKGVAVASLAVPSREYTTRPTVLSTDGRVFQFRDNRWDRLAGDAVVAMSASEQSPDLIYTAADGIHFATNEGKNVVLPPLPSGTKIQTLRATAVDNLAVAYVLGGDGRVYTSSADRGSLAFADWSTLPQSDVIAFSPSTTGGADGILTDGKEIFLTDGRRLPDIPADATVALVGRGATATEYPVPVNWFMDLDGHAYSHVDGAPGWTPVNADLVRGMAVSATHEGVVLGRD